MNRGAGVLMHVASLPGPFGIGVFGEEAVAFARQLKKAGMKYWQVLPFSYPGMGNSPYQSFSAFAGNWLFIDPRSLMKMGLLSADEVVAAEYKENKWRIDYDFLRIDREKLLRKAFSRCSDEIKNEVKNFVTTNKWVDDVACYQAIKDDNYEKPWWEWQDEKLKNYEPKAVDAVRGTENYLFHAFVQFVFSKEWQRIKKEINDIGISMIGDMPIYVSGDSSDVWAKRELFKMAKKGDEEHVFEKVAGVPPDYFCVDGQLWGNPIYDWAKHKATGYAWWMDRLAENYKLYDYVRIDHFRAFSSYWEIDAGAATAREGKWVEGPGMDFFDVMNKHFGDGARLFAEDLGEMTPDLESFMQECGLPGMNVMQFAFNPAEDSKYLPHNYKKNSISYTGTHDNNTLLGWLWEASESERKDCLDYCGFTGGDWGCGGPAAQSCRAVIKTLWMSHSDCVVVPVQDLLGYGSDTRMNTPGTANGNWLIRFAQDDLNKIDTDWLFDLGKLYRRV